VRPPNGPFEELFRAASAGPSHPPRHRADVDAEIPSEFFLRRLVSHPVLLVPVRNRLEVVGVIARRRRGLFLW